MRSRFYTFTFLFIYLIDVCFRSFPLIPPQLSPVHVSLPNHKPRYLCHNMNVMSCVQPSMCLLFYKLQVAGGSLTTFQSSYSMIPFLRVVKWQSNFFQYEVVSATSSLLNYIFRVVSQHLQLDSRCVFSFLFFLLTFQQVM